MAKEIGEALAEKLAPRYEVAVYTRKDKEYVHNHIIINSVYIEVERIQERGHGLAIIIDESIVGNGKIEQIDEKLYSSLIGRVNNREIDFRYGDRKNFYV